MSARKANVSLAFKRVETRPGTFVKKITFEKAIDFWFRCGIIIIVKGIRVQRKKEVMCMYYVFDGTDKKVCGFEDYNDALYFADVIGGYVGYYVA